MAETGVRGEGATYVYITWCPSSRSRVTERTVTMPGSAATRRRGTRPSAGSPGRPGTRHRTHRTSSAASTDSTPKAARQPTASASAVPAGTPSDRAR